MKAPFALLGHKHQDVNDFINEEDRKRRRPRRKRVRKRKGR